MAELDTSSGGGHKKGPGVKKPKKASTRIDFTPMVDLGFLLITFFIFTTTMQKPKTMEIIMPVDKDDIKDTTQLNKVKASTVLTALLGRDNRVYYYYGIGDDPMHPPEMKVTTFKKQGGIRDALIALKKKVADMQTTGGLLKTDAATVLIKPDSNCNYEDVVNMLDEMQINDIGIYALVDISAQDREFIKLTEQANVGTIK